MGNSTILKINTKPIKLIFLVCVHAPIETSEEETKNDFDNKFNELYDSLPGNTIKLVLGDLYAKCGT